MFWLLSSTFGSKVVNKFFRSFLNCQNVF